MKKLMFLFLTLLCLVSCEPYTVSTVYRPVVPQPTVVYTRPTIVYRRPVITTRPIIINPPAKYKYVQPHRHRR